VEEEREREAGAKGRGEQVGHTHRHHTHAQARTTTQQPRVHCCLQRAAAVWQSLQVEAKALAISHRARPPTGSQREALALLRPPLRRFFVMVSVWGLAVLVAKGKRGRAGCAKTKTNTSAKRPGSRRKKNPSLRLQLAL
jgi:hypothetical protein